MCVWLIYLCLQFQIFLQAFLLCLIHLSASILYVVMQFIEVPKFLTIISQYLWQLAQGLLCV